MRCALTTLVAAFLFATSSSEAADVRSKLDGHAKTTVTEVIDGDTVVIVPAIDGATQIRLVGLQAPKLPLGRKGFRMWPLAPQSKTALERIVLGKPISLAFGGARKDRYGRLLAHIFTDAGDWVQGAMLKRGMARIYTFPDNRALADEMYAAEHEARDSRRGIWGFRFYAVRDGADINRLMEELGTFQVIEGTVLDAARVKGRIYLNFGADWRSDFTVLIPRKTAKIFEKSGLDPLALENPRVRVRGWLKKRNGPMIQASHPEQIESRAP